MELELELELELRSAPCGARAPTARMPNVGPVFRTGGVPRQTVDPASSQTAARSAPNVFPDMAKPHGVRPCRLRRARNPETFLLHRHSHSPLRRMPKGCA